MSNVAVHEIAFAVANRFGVTLQELRAADLSDIDTRDAAAMAKCAACYLAQKHTETPRDEVAAFLGAGKAEVYNAELRGRRLVRWRGEFGVCVEDVESEIDKIHEQREAEHA